MEFQSTCEDQYIVHCKKSSKVLVSITCHSNLPLLFPGIHDLYNGGLSPSDFWTARKASEVESFSSLLKFWSTSLLSRLFLSCSSHPQNPQDVSSSEEPKGSTISFRLKLLIMPIVYWCCAIDYSHCQKLYRILERAPFPLIVYKDLHMSCKFLNSCKYFSIYRKNVQI